MTETVACHRDANGRFLPGSSGNPMGKRPGTRNRATVLREALAEGEDIAAARIVIDKALAGDGVAARFLIGRLMPRPRGREIALDLPEGDSAADVLAASDVTLQAMAAGEITPDEALTVTRILDSKLRALEAARRERERARPETRSEPSPPGRGQGEGAGRAPDDADIASARHPRPMPRPLSRTPLVPAAASGVAEPHRKPEGETVEGRNFPADLLHSTCISRPAAMPDRRAA